MSTTNLALLVAVERLKIALRKFTEHACSFNCDAESACTCKAHQMYRNVLTELEKLE